MLVNGRFLKARPTGLHRVGRSLLDAARASGLDLRVLAPPGTEDGRVDRHLWAPPGTVGDHLWEQVILPAAAGGRPILSLANTAPLVARQSTVMVHDLAFVVRPEWFSRAGRLYGRLVLAGARRARMVLAPSKQVREELVAHGVAADRAFVVRNALDDRFRPADAAQVSAVRSRHGIERPYLVHVGWADPRKDVATAAAAHVRVAADVPHELVLVGATHRNLAPMRPPNAPTIRRLGYVPDEDLIALLTGAEGFLYPSRYEGFGLPPLEATACGTPAIVSDIPVLRESMEGRGCFVPPGDVDAWADAIHRVLRGAVPVQELPAHTWLDAAGQLRSALGRLGYA